MPLTHGRYNVTNPVWSALGQTVNSNQSAIAARTNAAWGSLFSLTDASAITTTGVSASVPVPVEVGDVITTIGFLVGATAAATATHSFTALYSGVPTTPALLGQSADNVTADGGFTASGLRTFTLASPILITAAIAPTGFIYATMCVTGGTLPTLASWGTPAAVFYQWLSTQPLKGVAAITHGSAQNAVAAATIATPTVAATTPLVILR